MKKRYISVLLLALAIPFTGIAQSHANRTANTIVADVMAKLPAQNQTIFNKQMEDLASKGDQTVALLLDMMKTPASVGNNQVEYALSGLTYYVAIDGRDDERKEVTQAYVDALGKLSDREVKAFVIRQIQITGDDDVVDVLKGYAISKDLFSEATRALVSIGTPEAKAAVSEIMTKIPDKKTAAKAAGDMGLKAAEDLLVSWLNTGDINLQKSVINALGRVGAEKSLDVLRDEADKVNYGYDTNGALEAYLLVKGRLAEESPAEYEKSLIGLLKNDSENVRVFAINTLAAQKSPVVFSAALKALSSKDDIYRYEAIKAATEIAGEYFFVNEKFDFNKLSTAAKVDVVNICADSRYKCLTDEIVASLSSSNDELQSASFRALAMLAPDEALCALVGVFKSNDKSSIDKSANVLCWIDKEVRCALDKALDGASNYGKVAVLKTLAYRGATDSADKVIGYTEDSNKEIKTAAYKAIIEVATMDELSKLYSMLESAPREYIADVQDAIGGALGSVTSSEAYEIVLKQFNATSPSKKHLYYGVFSYTNTEEAFKIVAAGIKSNDTDTQTAALESALAWKGKEAIQTVYEVIVNPKLKSYKSQAVKSYVTLVKNAKFNDQQIYLYIRKALESVDDAANQNALLSQLRPLNSFGALLTAGKYLDNPKTLHVAGTAVLIISQKDRGYANWSKDVEKVLNKFIDTRKGGDAGYEIHAIKTYMGDAPKDKAGYEKIFNEKDLTGWKGLVKNPIARSKMSKKELAAAQIKADEVMNTGWEVKDEVLYFTGKGNNLCTEKKYGDFEMYVDWYIEKDGDAGIYLRGSPQVQIWDTSLVKVGAQVGSGGLYNNSKNPSKPSILADGRIGDWNTFYIKMIGERVTVALNGVTVVDNVIFENYWDRSNPIFLEEQLELQAHGSLVGYRDIYVKELPKVEPIELSAEEKKERFELLFDGVSMSNWIGNTKGYVAENGTITLYPGNGGSGHLYSKKEYDDFIFRFEFKLTNAANNGLGIRTPIKGNPAYVGIELQILDNEHPVYSKLKKYQYHGSVYGVIPAKRGFLKPIGEWNSQEVYIKGNDIKVTLNGEVIVEGNLAEASKNGTLDKKNHPGLKNKTGHIGFLGHGSIVSFKNIRVKEL